MTGIEGMRETGSTTKIGDMTETKSATGAESMKRADGTKSNMREDE
jgi:hypothetical protein